MAPNVIDIRRKAGLGAVGMPTLKRGSRGPNVQALQTALTAAGFPTTADGIFGPATEQAVAAFQESTGRSIDPPGTVGQGTWDVLRERTGIEFVNSDAGGDRRAPPTVRDGDSPVPSFFTMLADLPLWQKGLIAAGALLAVGGLVALVNSLMEESSGNRSPLSALRELNDRPCPRPKEPPAAVPTDAELVA